MRLLDRLWATFPTFLIARRNITRARTRSALAVASIVIGVVASTVGGLYPAWSATRERPVEALRG